MTFIGLVADAGLVGINEVILAELVGREVRHDDVGTSEDGFFAALRVEGLVGRGRHHVDFRHHQAKRGNHLQGQFHALFGGRDLVFVRPKRRVRVGDKRPHSDHRHFLLLEE